jgi:hypothetical protein
MKESVEANLDFGGLLSKFLGLFCSFLFILGTIFCIISKEFWFLLFWDLGLSTGIIAGFFTKRNITVDFHKEECSASYKVFNQNFLLKKYPFNDTSYFIIDYETVEDSEGKGIQHYLCLFTNGNEYRIRIHNFLDESNLDLNSLRKAGIKVLIDEELKRNLRTSITFTGLPKDKFRN